MPDTKLHSTNKEWLEIIAPTNKRDQAKVWAETLQKDWKPAAIMQGVITETGIQTIWIFEREIKHD